MSGLATNDVRQGRAHLTLALRCVATAAVVPVARWLAREANLAGAPVYTIPMLTWRTSWCAGGLWIHASDASGACQWRMLEDSLKLCPFPDADPARTEGLLTRRGCAPKIEGFMELDWSDDAPRSIQPSI